ncbi:unnamed protein product [Phytomonas sp. EM1]|nr:unnamed protein product [Phytomonas sp. EM1]|eukprot:CCW60612.1 unnamed protein product [Phytomonas sp. isolate EM1]
MTDEENTYDLLRFVALSTSVHADAVQCAVDDLQKVVHQKHSEEALLKVYEKELNELSEQSKKLHVMHRLVTVSREERQKGKPLRAAGSEVSYGGSDKKHIQSTRRPKGVHPDTRCRPKPRLARPTGEVTPFKPGADDSTPTIPAESESIAQTTLALDAQLAHLKQRMAELDAMSIHTKLTTLESLKRQASEVDAAAILQRHVSAFEFPPEVRRLWGEKAAASSFPAAKPTRQTPSIRKKNNLGDFAPEDSNPVVNLHTIDPLIDRACRRLNARYQHILDVLATSGETLEDDAQRLLEHLLYAEKLESPDNDDVAAVQTLQGLPLEAFTAHDARERSRFSAEAQLAERCLGRPQTVLSRLSYCALPMAWETTRRLSETPLESFLPPARHILTPRFSFTNLSELNRLDRLRVHAQRLFLIPLLGNRQLVEDMLHHEGGALPIELKEKAILDVRAAIADAMASQEKPPAWITTVAIQPEQLE